MDDIHAQFARADSMFYDLPRTSGASAPFEVETRDGWETAADDVWTHHGPRSGFISDQGWKIHVSATLATATTVLRAVADCCYATATPFKHLRNATQLMRALSKDADRGSSGKFVTLYPADEHALEAALNVLDSRIGGLPGPYILSDLRWGEGPLYVRYGAFRRMLMVWEGIDTLAVRDLDSGDLVPDRRSLTFTVPPWVTLPDFMRPHADALASSPPARFPKVTAALHHSNAGGVYEAKSGDELMVLKEARPFTGHTPDGRDAITRLRDEAALLTFLDGIDVPRVLGTHHAFGHEFLALERVAGISLAEAVVARHPLIHPRPTNEARREYRDWALQVGGSIRTALRRLHNRGHTHGDLHPRNVLVNAGDQITFVDLEMSLPVDATEAATIGAAGFVPAVPRTPMRHDIYAMACIELFMFMPLMPLLMLDTSKAGQLLAAAASEFDLDSEWVSERLEVLSEGAPVPHSPPVELVDGVLEGLRVDMTPARQDRLWPGDPAQFTEPQGSIAHGALGVLLALNAAGHPPTDEQRDWLKHALLTPSANRRFGLMDGHAGAAWGLRALGDEQGAERELDELRAVHLESLPSDLYAGLPGVGLALLEHSTAEPSLLDVTVRAARILRERIAALEPQTQVATGRGGLLAGATGTALFALRLYERTGDASHLRLARSAIEHDIASLVDGGDGTLNVNERWRALPYLGSGSAGIGVVLAQILQHTPNDGSYLEVLAGIIRSSLAPFSIQSGLLQGRAGLVHFLVMLEDMGFGTAESASALAGHVAALPLHALGSGAVRFAGNGLLRASCDLATGSAGVLTALLAYRSHLNGIAPSFCGVPFLQPATKRTPAHHASENDAQGGR